jgi:hypothetical protein
MGSGQATRCTADGSHTLQDEKAGKVSFGRRRKVGKKTSRPSATAPLDNKRDDHTSVALFGWRMTRGAVKSSGEKISFGLGPNEVAMK